MSNGPTEDQVADALKAFGNYRVLRTQEVAKEGYNDGIGGSHLLALGMRETWLRNVEGGAKLVDGKWVAEDNPKKMDVGWVQISRTYHPMDLARMPGVKSGTWSPTVRGATANDAGYCPRFTDALRFAIESMREAIAAAEDYGIPKSDRVRFAIAAHNAGIGGAWRGRSSGDIDRFTTGGDYSAWVMKARARVTAWLNDHPNWRYP